MKGNVNREEKERIARKAVELLNDNDSIIMASGSTIYAFAEAIKREFRSHLNVVTTFLKTSVLLNDVEEINVVQLGGCVHKKSLSAIGGYAEAALSDFSCSKLFFGVDGIDLEHGITTSTIEEAKLTQVMMRSASKIIILADSSKFGQRGFGRICSLEEIDVIVTDSRISEQAVAMAEEAGCRSGDRIGRSRTARRYASGINWKRPFELSAKGRFPSHGGGTAARRFISGFRRRPCRPAPRRCGAAGCIWPCGRCATSNRS